MLDTAIKKGRVISGTGNPWFFGDIGIKGGKIERVGGPVSQARRTLEVKGLVVCPGFIDMHSHSDTLILANSRASSKVMQGVTTEVTGNCGTSPAPVTEEMVDELKSCMSFLADEDWSWRSLGDYFNNVKRKGILCNICPLVGEGTIRIGVMGFEDREPTKEEMKKMKELLKEAMEEGAFGLSTGLIYPPGCFTKTEELIELAKVLQEYDGIYASHVRGEAGTLLEGVKEAIRTGRESKVGVEISHHKACGKRNWGKVKETLKLIEEAREKGLDVTCDQYPYTASSTHLTTACLPPWVHKDGVRRLLERLRNSDTRKKIKKQIEEEASIIGWDNVIKENGWGSIVISQVNSRKNKELEGKSLKEVVESKGRDPFDVLFDFLLEEKGNVSGVMFQMSEEDVQTVMTHPATMIGSDGSCLSASAPRGKPHPRSYGTYPRVLGKYVREKNILTLEEAVRKMTSFPAQKLGLKDRGLLKEGHWADIVVFDPDKITDKATYENPHQYPAGIEYVIVNGELVVERGELTDKAPGEVLKKDRA